MVTSSSRQSRPRRLQNALAAAGVSAALVAAGPGLAGRAFADGSTAGSGSGAGKTLRVAMDGSGVDTLNPFTAYFNGALDLFGGIYPTLTTIDDAGKSAPYLAKSWKLSDDHLTWTFQIADGLKWSDGQPLTAEDAAWTLNLIMTDDVAGTANGTLVANFESVTAPDATTLVVKTKQPQSNLDYISIPVSGIPIVPKHVWEAHTKDLKDFKNESTPVVGYGPWVLTEFKTGEYAKLDANKTFLLGAPKYDHLIEQIYKETDAAVAALKAGQLDYIEGVNATQFKTLQGASGVQTAQAVGNGWFGLELNAGAKTRTGKPIGTGNPALADPVLRKAIALAVDKKTLVAKVLDGQGQVAEGYLPPAWPQWSWKPADDQLSKFDPAAANKLLDDAGYKAGSDGVRVDPKTSKPLNLRLGIHSDDTQDAAVSNYLVSWFKAIGINATIQPMSMSALNSDLGKGNWDMLMDAWTTGPDPTYLLGIQSCGTLPNDDGSGGNTDSFFCDADYDKLFAQQSTIFDPAERAKVVGQMQEILYQGNSNIMFYNSTHKIAANAKVSGLLTGTKDANGFYPAQSSFWSYLKAAPAAEAAGSSGKDGGSGAGLWIGVIVAVVVVGGGGVLVLRRRSGADDRE
ncbi:ABC transporter substrate-binding protein [Catenulispora yoronensis]|uniref:ABC transporter substrate-binding protein n=1 Tax=Catenulispora yoronensis TaxID=450799 RepID=A0ABN2VK88_9ACTN